MYFMDKRYEAQTRYPGEIHPQKSRLSSSSPLYSRREILVGKGFLNVNCPTFDDWAIIFKVPVMTI